MDRIAVGRPQRIFEQLLGEGADVSRLLRMALSGQYSHGFRVLRWWRKGPSNPDLLHAEVQVHRDELDSILERAIVVHNDRVRVGVEVAQPTAPDPELLHVHLTVTRRPCTLPLPAEARSVGPRRRLQSGVMG